MSKRSNKLERVSDAMNKNKRTTMKPPAKFGLAMVAFAYICCAPSIQPAYAKFSSLITLLPGMQPVIMSQLWLPVPRWLAGTWQGNSQLLIYSYNYKECRNLIEEPVKIEISRSSTIGVQQDSSGQIWHYTGAPYVQTIRTPNYIEHQQINRLSLISSSAAAVTVRSESTVTHTDSANKELIDEFIEQN